MESGLANVPKRVFFGCFAQLVIMILGIVIVVQMNAIGNVSEQNLSTIEDLIDDWSTVPFTEITVTDAKCPSGTENIFVREWGGIEEGCLVQKLGESEQVMMTKDEYETYVNSKVTQRGNQVFQKNQIRRREPCTPISRQVPVKQGVFFDKHFCGKRGG